MLIRLMRGHANPPDWEGGRLGGGVPAAGRLERVARHTRLARSRRRPHAMAGPGWEREQRSDKRIVLKCPHTQPRRSAKRRTVQDQTLSQQAAGLVTFQVPIERRSSSLFSVLARREGEEDRGLHHSQCPCEMCDNWREDLLWGSDAEGDGVQSSGYVFESDAE